MNCGTELCEEVGPRLWSDEGSSWGEHLAEAGTGALCVVRVKAPLG